MAESALCQIVLENLASIIKDEIGLLMGVDEEMRKLSSTFTTIQAVLQDAEEKKLGSKELQNWLGKLKDLTFEIEDILDECATHAGKGQLRNSKLSCCSLQNVVFRHDIGTRMKQLTKRLDVVAAEREQFGLTMMPAIENPREVLDGRATGSILNESHLTYGREEDQEKIVKMLVNDLKRNQQLSVLPIIGLGGLGKTTLAQSIYKDHTVVKHFEKRLWVCVSDNFDQETLVRAIIESATKSGTASDIKQLDILQHRLREELNGKRYLLVLDDVWNEVQEKWSLLKNILSCGSHGASIIVTTRLQMVADIMGTLPPHRLEGLSKEHCWLLMKECAFTEEEKGKYPNLEAIGKQIVKKCAGVPMAAKALGGLLRFKRTENEWKYVEESELWNLPEEETLILPALRLSYHHLPVELRQCFAYFAVFPKDHRIQKKKLIDVWIAHGYISSKGKLEVEDVGNDICNKLVSRSLFQYDSSHGDYIMMHDLVHDLAQSIMENKVPGVEMERRVGSSTSNTKIRQVILQENSVAFPPCTQDMNISSIITEFKRLRVLDASYAGINDVPSTVGNLKHLRLLNLSSSRIRILPSSLCSLWNLKILNLDSCTELAALPKKMRYLKNLRHLHMEGCYSLEGMPTQIGELTGLKTLSVFIVGHERGDQLEELECLKLGGRLEIKRLERVGSYMDAKKANLSEKKELRDLILEWGSNDEGETRGDKDEKVLEALQPHPNLQTLTIRCFSGRCFPLWMADSTFENVVDIVIKDCPQRLQLPQLGKLPHLESLRVENVGVEYLMNADENAVDVDTILFPSLKTLKLHSLPRLKGLSKEQLSSNVFPNLRKLMMESCSSITLPQLSLLKQLNIQNCGGLNLTSSADLEDLTLEVIENVRSIPMEILEKLTDVKSLRVVGAEEESLPEEGMRTLKSITMLSIERSKRLRCLPGGWLRHLTALRSLTVRECPELVEVGEEIKELECLQTVMLEDVTNMECVPKALRHLSSLRELRLWRLHQLNTLPEWLDELTSLEALRIFDCPKLVSLPTCVEGISNLQFLAIRECPEELIRRCERGSGEEWHKIAHIPKLLISGNLHWRKK